MKKLIVFSLLVTSAPLHAAAVYTDLWDVSQGSVVTGNSAVHSGSNIYGMFGGSGGIEAETTLFADQQAAGTTHWVEWETPDLVNLTSINLIVGDDGVAFNGQRGISEFRLYAYNSSTTTYDLVYSYNPDANPHDYLEVSAALTGVTAQQFRAEFDQYGSTTFSGPRIFELDGFGSVVPIPAAAWLFGSGLGLLGWIRKRKIAVRQ